MHAKYLKFHPLKYIFLQTDKNKDIKLIFFLKITQKITKE